jgi:Retroviral aspartyl protease
MPTQVYSFVKNVGTDGTEFFRPWVPIKIMNANDSSKSIIVHALLDTGADECIFTLTPVIQAGLDLKSSTKTKEMQGVGKDKIMTWYHPFKVAILKPDLKTVFWSSKEIEVACVDHDNIVPILGFTNLLYHFKLTFNYSSRKLMLDDKPLI